MIRPRRFSSRQPAPHIGSSRGWATERFWGTVAVVVSAIVGGIAGVVWLWCALVMLSSRISTDPGSFPNGFGVMFGLAFGIPAGLVCWSVLPASSRPNVTIAAAAALPRRFWSCSDCS
ncbi:hypothetical protein MARA_02870 (plasmid) [Mycolicibacterium arabiense]|uniref:Uncharacterized protein n=1 Tax=Mycolicibacterium arabiense TaxID=1286181 RepID=A0A7I7RQR5_9MYCO|nr:hypothetical protein MARA_02870 [Mycolicibacterium arabiense]